MREIHAIPLLTGHCRHPECMTLRDGRWQPVDFPALATLLIHPDEGPVLFDTGYDPAFMAATRRFPERLYRWATPVSHTPGQDAASQCAALGYEPTAVRHLVLSHFHGDHVAGIHAFPNAQIHCARAGLQDVGRGGRLTSTRRGILRALLPADIAARARFFEDAPSTPLPSWLSPFERGADLLGDGSLLAVELPGHCPGHWGLLIEDARRGPHFLVADAAWSSDAIRRDMPPPGLTTAFLGDTRSGRKTLNALHQVWSRSPDIRLTPSHCRERAAEAQAEA